MKHKLIIISTLLILIANTSFSMYKQFNDRSMWYYNSPTPSAMLLISGNGNVGIGSSAPATRLDVAGTVSASALVVNGAVGYNGSIAYKVVNKTTNYTAGDESIILVNASAGNVTVNLPVASTASGRVYQIKKTDSSGNSVCIAGNGSETIDGATSVSTNNQYGGYAILSDGSNWLLTSYVAGIPRPDFATGGTITEVGGYRIHTFTSSGTFTVNRGGNVEYLVVGGGGGGGGVQANTGGAGGGAGGYRNSVLGETTGGGGVAEVLLAVAPGAITVTVGAGGDGGTSGNGVKGGNSVFGSITAEGGGYGSKGLCTSGGGDGGSGGGGSYTLGGNRQPSTVQGYNGGTGISSAGAPTGGGGGAGQAGQNGGVVTNTGGKGGDGLSSSITGVAVTRAGGGGGSTDTIGNGGGAGGTGGGGAGGSSGNGTAGIDGTGSGGGGKYYSGGTSGGNGGSGIVIIRYPISQ